MYVGSSVYEIIKRQFSTEITITLQLNVQCYKLNRRYMRYILSGKSKQSE